METPAYAYNHTGAAAWANRNWNSTSHEWLHFSGDCTNFVSTALNSGVNFPNDASLLRLVSAVIVQTHDESQLAQRRYLSEESMAKISSPDNADNHPRRRPLLP